MHKQALSSKRLVERSSNRLIVYKHIQYWKRGLDELLAELLTIKNMSFKVDLSPRHYLCIKAKCLLTLLPHGGSGEKE